MRNRSKRYLLPYNRFQSVAAGAGPVVLKASEVGIPANRPARPHAIEVRFASSTPSGVRFRVYAGNGEEVYQSPALVSGHAPQLFRVTLPANTDFAMYGSDQPAMELAGTAQWAVRLTMAYKENTA